MKFADSSPTGQHSTKRKTSATSVYGRIRADILSLSLVPASDLDEKTLAQQYSVSRTPIREALIQLSGDGLIEFSPSRGARVAPLVLPNFPRYLEALDLVQRALVRIGALRMLRNDEAKLKTALTRFGKFAPRLDIADYRSVERIADAEFAALQAIGECAHNAYLFDAFGKLLVQGQRMLRLPFGYNPSGGILVGDYARIRIEALSEVGTAFAAQDGKTAEIEMRRFHAALIEQLTAYTTENLASEVTIEPFSFANDPTNPTPKGA